MRWEMRFSLSPYFAQAQRERQVPKTLNPTQPHNRTGAAYP